MSSDLLPNCDWFGWFFLACVNVYGPVGVDKSKIGRSLGRARIATLGAWATLLLAIRPLTPEFIQ